MSANCHDQWNPMLEHYNSPHNSYSIAKSGESQPACSEDELFITGIPNTMTDVGICNLFSSAGQVRKVRLLPSKHPSYPNTMIGFVQVANKAMGLKIIGEFNNYRIADNMLKIQFSKSKTSEMPGGNMGRGDGKQSANYNQSRPKYPIQHDVIHAGNKGNAPVGSQLSAVDTSPSAASSSVHNVSPAPKPPCIAEAANVCVVQSTTEAQQINECKVSGNRVASAGTSAVSSDSVCNSCGNPGNCIHCVYQTWLPHGQRCGQCKSAYYCSLECQRKDWPSHKLICNNVSSTKQEPIQCTDTVIVDDSAVEKVCNQIKQAAVNEVKVDPVDKQVNGRNIPSSVLCLHSPTEVVVTSLGDSPSEEIWVMKTDQWALTVEMKTALNAVYANTDSYQVKENVLSIGSYYASQFSEDMEWYRVVIEAINSNGTLCVRYVDYGNIEVVPASNICELDSRFLTQPRMAIRCKLHNIVPKSPAAVWSQEAIVCLRSLIQPMMKVYTITAEKLESDVYHISIRSENQDIIEELLKAGFAGRPTTSPISERIEDVQVAPMSYPSAAKYFAVGRKIPVKVLNLTSPSQFWICDLSSLDLNKLDKMHEQMNLHYSNLPTKTHFRPVGNNLYAVLVKQTGSWFRGHALSYDTEKVNVILLDKGTWAQSSFTELHPLEGQFLTIPFQAVQCSLAGLNHSGSWPRSVVNYFRELVDKREDLTATITDVGQNVATIALYLSSGDMVANLITRNFEISTQHLQPVGSSPQRSILARPEEARTPVNSSVESVSPTTPSLALNKPYKVHVLHAANPRDITVCSLKQKPALVELCAQINSVRRAGGYEPRVGEMVAARYAADGNWYRANVKQLLNGNNVLVRYADFGNEAEVSCDSIAKLEQDFVAARVLSLTVELCGTKHSTCTSWNAEIDPDLIFEMIVVERRGQSNVVELYEMETRQALADIIEPRGKVAGHDQTTVELSEDVSAGNVSSAASAVKDTTPLNLMPSSVEALETTSSAKKCTDTTVALRHLPENEVNGWCQSKCPVQIVHVNTPSDFYIQSLNLVDLAKLFTEMNEFCDQCGTNYCPSVGEIVAAKYTVYDGKWYRAIVMEAGASGCTVQFVDYGNILEVGFADVRKLPAELALTLPRQAVPCALDRCVGTEAGGKYSDSAVMFLNELVDSRQLYLRMAYRSDTDSSTWQVDLVDCQESKALRELLLSKKLAQPPSCVQSADTTVKAAAENPQPQPFIPVYADRLTTRPHLMTKMKVLVTSVQSPADFYVQLMDEKSSRDRVDLMVALAKTGSEAPIYKNPKVGELVAARGEKFVYRAEVLEVDTFSVKVSFVDYGYEQLVDRCDLFSIPVDLVDSYPRQAVRCTLKGITGTGANGDFLQKATNWFVKLFMNEECVVTDVLYREYPDKYPVDLITSGCTESAVGHLISEKMATRIK